MQLTEDMKRVLASVKLLTFQRWKAQCKSRGETVLLDYPQWCELWGDLWYKRGRAIDSYCITRKDWKGDWTVDNSEIVTRKDHFNTRHFKKQQAAGDARLLGRKATNPMEKF